MTKSLAMSALLSRQPGQWLKCQGCILWCNEIFFGQKKEKEKEDGNKVFLDAKVNKSSSLVGSFNCSETYIRFSKTFIVSILYSRFR